MYNNSCQCKQLTFEWNKPKPDNYKILTDCLARQNLNNRLSYSIQDLVTCKCKAFLKISLLNKWLKYKHVNRLTSNFWHLASTSSLEWQETQIFLFLSLFFGSSVAIGFKTFASWQLHWRSCSPLTFPCFHSSWWGQQQYAWNSIVNDNKVPKANKNKLYTLFDTI